MYHSDNGTYTLNTRLIQAPVPERRNIMLFYSHPLQQPAGVMVLYLDAPEKITAYAGWKNQ